MANTILGEARPAQASIRSSGGIPVLDETYMFLVRAASKNTSRISVLLTPGLPIVGQTVSAFGFSVCKSKSAVRRENQADLWDVTCEFSSEVDERKEQARPDQNPEEWRPIYETKFERLQEIATRDENDVAIANSAGQPFENGIIRARFIPVWEFFQFEPPSITDEQVLDRNEVINSANFRGKPSKTLLCTVMSSVIGYYYGSLRRFTKYSLRYNYKNWRHKRLDVGTVYLDGAEHPPYLDASGNVMLGGLDGSGNKVAVGDPPAILQFDMYPAVDFNSFLRF